MKYLALFALLLPLFFVTGCGDSYDKIGADILANAQAMRDTLKTVKDIPTATSAAERIKSINVEMQQVQVRLNKLGKPTKEEGDLLNTKYQSQINDAKKAIDTERERIAALGKEVSGPIDAAMSGGQQRARRARWVSQTPTVKNSRRNRSDTSDPCTPLRFRFYGFAKSQRWTAGRATPTVWISPKQKSFSSVGSWEGWLLRYSW